MCVDGMFLEADAVGCQVGAGWAPLLHRSALVFGADAALAQVVARRALEQRLPGVLGDALLVLVHDVAVGALHIRVGLHLHDTHAVHIVISVRAGSLGWRNHIFDAVVVVEVVPRWALDLRRLHILAIAVVASRLVARVAHIVRFDLLLAPAGLGVGVQDIARRTFELRLLLLGPHTLVVGHLLVPFGTLVVGVCGDDDLFDVVVRLGGRGRRVVVFLLLLAHQSTQRGTNITTVCSSREEAVICKGDGHHNGQCAADGEVPPPPEGGALPVLANTTAEEHCDNTSSSNNNNNNDTKTTTKDGRPATLSRLSQS
mmetsp:Transcript_49285/g.123522  ORF Transcript_49285/g.123522 Transcript_49285/m.123522 type:complete len:314 (+) Transcript_49285:1454-2395(+)